MLWEIALNIMRLLPVILGFQYLSCIATARLAFPLPAPCCSGLSLAPRNLHCNTSRSRHTTPAPSCYCQSAYQCHLRLPVHIHRALSLGACCTAGPPANCSSPFPFCPQAPWSTGGFLSTPLPAFLPWHLFPPCLDQKQAILEQLPGVPQHIAKLVEHSLRL